MKTLIVEDDFTSRLLLQELLRSFGEAHIAINGKEAVEAARIAREAGEPYDLICMDIMMPEMDGQEALKQIRSQERNIGKYPHHHYIHRATAPMLRDLEEAKDLISPEGTKIIMVTSLGDMKNINEAFHGLCDGYLVKPIHKAKLFEELRKLKLIS